MKFTEGVLLAAPPRNLTRRPQALQSLEARKKQRRKTHVFLVE